MLRRRALIATSLLLALAACDDRNPASPGSNDPAAIIYDGTRSDDADDFFFLPPMMPDPKGHDNFDDGAFNAQLGPEVRICELAADPNNNALTDCVLLADGTQKLIASFSSSAVQVSVTGEHYQVNWHTDDSPVAVDKFYRIQVYLGSTRVGFADLDPISSARELKNLRTGEVIPLVDGRTLPIRFRIERGALCENKLDCGEFKVTNDGGTFLTNTKYAGIRFEPGALPPGVDHVTLTIERVQVGSDNACHGASNVRLWKQFEACYSFETDPEIVLHAPAMVGKCTELSTTDPLYDMQLGYKSSDGAGLKALPNVILPFDFGLECDTFNEPVITQASNPLLRFAQAGWRGLGRQVSRVFGVRTAYAIDLGLGDRLVVGDGFSNINWGIGLDAVITSGGEQSVGFGLAAEPLAVRVAHEHVHIHSTDGDDEYADSHFMNMGGVPVTFTVTRGSGYFGLDGEGNPVRTALAMTSIEALSEGLASVAFTADPNASDNVVTATAPTLSPKPLQFVITGLASDLVVEGLVLATEDPSEGEQLEWNFTVRNGGTGRAVASTASLAVSFVGEGRQLVQTHRVVIPPLAPGGSHFVAIESASEGLGAGTYEAVATADVGPAETPGSQVVEASEANNAAAPISFEVRATPSATTTLLNGLHYPTGLWIGNEVAYLTETAGHNTSFGGNDRVLRFDLATGALGVVLAEPINNDAVVVTADGRLVLTSYVGSTPGESGRVSVAEFDSESGAWSESHVLDVAIASHDLHLEADGDLYLIGSSDDPKAASLYRLLLDECFPSAQSVRTGLGRARAVTTVGSVIYYSTFTSSSVRSFDGEIDRLLVGDASVTSLTSDGTWLYFAEFAQNRIRRVHLTTGAIELVVEGLRHPLAVRYHAPSGRLYFLEGGTEAGQYRDGRLQYIQMLR